MSATADQPELPLASEALVSTHAKRFAELGERSGITQLRFAAEGRLVGRVAEDRDMFDVVDFQLAVAQEFGVKITLVSDAVLGRERVSPDLVNARPL